MIKKYVLAFTLILGMLLTGCGSKNEESNTTEETVSENETQNTENQTESEEVNLSTENAFEVGDTITTMKMSYKFINEEITFKINEVITNQEQVLQMIEDHNAAEDASDNFVRHYIELEDDTLHEDELIIAFNYEVFYPETFGTKNDSGIWEMPGLTFKLVNENNESLINSKGNEVTILDTFVSEHTVGELFTNTAYFVVLKNHETPLFLVYTYKDEEKQANVLTYVKLPDLTIEN